MKLTDITPAPWNVRKITEDSVRELAASIKEQGLIQPIVVWKDGDGNALCIAGNRRLAAMKSIGYELADEEVVDFVGDENAARAVTIAENLQRENLGILDEAAAVTALLDLGETVYTVAAQLGKSPSWVNRRRKLAALEPEWKARGDEIDADALERIATYPADVQRRVAKTANAGARRWRDLEWAFERESRDLDAAKFDRDECRECLKRTGVEADLFGITDGDLGHCQDCKCYERKRKAWEDAEIAKLVGDAEVVRVKYAWELPRDEAAKDKRDKKHPCAYVYAEGHDGIEVKWGESAKAKAERTAAEQAKREAEREAENAERERADKVEEKLDAWKDETDDDGWPKGLQLAVVKRLDDNIKRESQEWIGECVRDAITGWHDCADWAAILEAFPEIVKLAGVSGEEAKWYCDYAKEEE